MRTGSIQSNRNNTTLNNGIQGNKTINNGIQGGKGGAAATAAFSFPFRDWCPLRVYSLSPSAIGARYGYILCPFLRLVPATGIFSLPCWRILPLHTTHDPSTRSCGVSMT
eukprot:7678366-Pyramimonas_sp.AAC.1